jgi:chitinase
MHIAWFFYFIFIVLISDHVTAFSVVAYLPEWRYEGANFETICQHVSHLIFFSLEPSLDGSGGITGMNRFPGTHVLRAAKDAAKRHGCKLLICFGGNGRSSGFSATTRNSGSLKTFIGRVAELLKQYDLDGVDINWEYPGYSFGSGYGDAKLVDQDYNGLIELMIGLRELIGKEKVITMAYYPDSRQERILVAKQAPLYIDLFHMMTYDQGKGHHSPFELASKSIEQALNLGLPANKLTLGLPFYGRHSRTGDWTTYEDLIQKYSLNPDADTVKDATGVIYFNGIKSIRDKTQHAIDRHIGGVINARLVFKPY